MMYPYLFIRIKLISKNYVLKSFHWNSLFSLIIHGDESMGRCKMSMRMWFIRLWMDFLGFPDILGVVGIKIPKFGPHRTEFGRAFINQTQNLEEKYIIHLSHE